VVYEAADRARVHRDLARNAALCDPGPIVLSHDRLAMVCRAARSIAPIVKPKPHQSGGLDE
jgi:hypothetical protein